MRRNQSILRDLGLLPWWINVILAGVVYISLRYWIPPLTFNSLFYKGMVAAAPGLANIAAMLLLFVAAISALNSFKKRKLLGNQKDIKTLRAISWQAFEELVGEAYRRKGYNVEEIGGGGADGGVDLVLRKGGEKLFVQCKHWKMEKVGVKVVRELYGVVVAERATGAVVISSGTFTQEAKDFARSNPIELLDGSELLQVIVDVQMTPTATSKKSSDSTCPLCGAKMVLRTAKKGPNGGGKFWGCSSFPKCKATKPFNA